MKVILIAPHRRSRDLQKYLREEVHHRVTTVGTWDGAKKYLGHGEDIIIFTPEVASDLVREFTFLKDLTNAKTLYITDWSVDRLIWDLLMVGLDGYCFQEPTEIDSAMEALAKQPDDSFS